jgi:hypothetical protein
VVAVITVEGDESAAQEHLLLSDVTDGLPVIIPTPERLRAYLEASGFEPFKDVVVGPVPPLNEPVTIAEVAVNALMAGARPGDLGLLLAAVEILQDPRFAADKLQFTTNPVAPFMLVNGPAVADLGLGTGNHALGPGRHPNGPIGRALRLVLRNLGGADDEVDHATHGQPAKYTFCLGEAEARSPWAPYHVTQGFSPDDSVVTLVGIESVINVVPVTDRHQPLAGPLVHQIGAAMQAVGTNRFFSHGTPVVVLCPGQVERLESEGYDRERLQRALFEAGQSSLDAHPYGNYCLGKWTVVNDKVLPCARPEDIVIVVAGGDESLHSLYLQPFYANPATSRRVWTPATMA